MNRHLIMERIISSEACVNLMDIRTGFFPREKWTDLTNAAARISEPHLLQIVDAPGLSVLNVRSVSRQVANGLKRNNKALGLIIVDYLQLMRGASRRFESRQQEVAEVSRGLKHLAREARGAGDRRLPTFAQARGQGARRQPPAAFGPARERRPRAGPDVVLLIYRESYYKQNDPTVDEKKTDIIIAKQRQGPTGTVPVQFHRQYTRFVDATNKAEPTSLQEAQTTFS